MRLGVVDQDDDGGQHFIDAIVVVQRPHPVTDLRLGARDDQRVGQAVREVGARRLFVACVLEHLRVVGQPLIEAELSLRGGVDRLRVLREDDRRVHDHRRAVALGQVGAGLLGG